MSMSTNSSEGAGSNGDDPGGTPANKEQAILSKLFFDEEDFLARLEDTIQRAMRFFRLEKHSGRVVLTDEAKGLKVRDQIRVLLAGRYFAWKLAIVGTDKMNYREIAVELNRPASGISPELSDLIREGDVVRDEESGLASMAFHRIDGTLRELEQAKTFVPSTEGEAPAEPRRNGARRPARATRMDPLVQSMLEKTVDLSEYGWVKDLNKALDKGLAALFIAKEKYSLDAMSCQQMATFLTRTFPVKVTRGAINMAFLEVKSQYVAPTSRGKDISYTLLPLGRERLLKTVETVLSQKEQEAETEDV